MSSKEKEDLIRPYRDLYHKPESMERLHGLLDGLVTVFVGRKEPFVVHRGFLCRESEYCQGTLNGRFSESESMQITLENESVRTFAMFLTWMYSRGILDPGENAFISPSPSGETRCASTKVPAPCQDDLESAAAKEFHIVNGNERVKRDLVDLFIFADRRGVRELRNHTTTRLIQQNEDYLGLLDPRVDLREHSSLRL